MTTNTTERSPVWEKAGAPRLAGMVCGSLAWLANPEMYNGRTLRLESHDEENPVTDANDATPENGEKELERVDETQGGRNRKVEEMTLKGSKLIGGLTRTDALAGSILVLLVGGFLTLYGQTGQLRGQIGTLDQLVIRMDGDVRSLMTNVGILSSFHGIRADALLRAPLDEFRAAVSPPIDRVESVTEWAPSSFSDGAVGLRFLSANDESTVPIRVMMDGRILSARPDRDPDFTNRLEFIIEHAGGFSSYYGIVAELSDRFQAVVDENDGNIRSLDNQTVIQGELLGFAQEASSIWMRLGLRGPDGPVNPLEVIKGFSYTDDLIVSEDPVR